MIPTILPDEVRDSLVRRARASSIEVCGYVGGRDGSLETVYQAHNAAAGASLFEIDPDEQRRLLERMAVIGQVPTALWHSHPAGDADLSGVDIACALQWNAEAPTNALWIVVGLRPEPEVAGYLVLAEHGITRTF